MTPARLVSIGAVPPNIFAHLQSDLGRSVPWIELVREPGQLDPSFAFDAARGQVLAPAVLDRLAALARSGRERVLGLTEFDLFIPVFSFVFGQGHVGGPAAVVSLRRLRPEAYGLPPNAATFLRRVSAEAVHELGHTFSLHHCEDDDCVMHASRTADEIDQRGLAFCAGCADLIPRTLMSR